MSERRQAVTLRTNDRTRQRIGNWTEPEWREQAAVMHRRLGREIRVYAEDGTLLHIEPGQEMKHG